MVWTKKVFLLLIVMFLFGSLTTFAVAHEGEDNFGHHSMIGGFHDAGLMSVYGWIFTIGLFLVLVLIILFLVKQLRGNK